MIRTLTRAAAALPLGAFALGVLPFGTTHAAANYEAEWGIAASCNGGHNWLLSFDNQGATPINVEFVTDEGDSEEVTVPGHTVHQLAVQGIEGLASTVRLLVNGTEVDSESTPLVDCLVDGDPFAEIEIVCPAPGSDEDIFVEYTMGVEGTATKFGWKTPDGGEDGQTISNWVDHVTYKVEQGQTIDVWVWNRDDNNSVLASLIDTVACPTEQVVEEDTPSSDDQGSAGQLPETGRGTTVAWLAAALTALGAAGLRLSRRQVTAAE
jgi:hypothetical protein